MATAITNPISPSLAGSTGSVLTYDFAVSGGLAPYVWGISDDSPAWLTISTAGLISGTPTTAGIFSATVQVTDSSDPQQQDSNTFNLVIDYGATIEGTLRLDTSDGVFAARKVYLYNYTTGALVDETTSNGTTGEWSFTTVAPGDYFVVGVATSDDYETFSRDFDAMGVITVV